MVAALAAFVAAAYAPSLGDGPRADHLAYFAEVAGDRSLRGLTLDQLVFNRTRAFNPGDALLFRPLLFVVLGLETYLFGYHFTLWQAAGLALHAAISLTLGLLLYRIRRGPFAWLIAVFFASLYVGMELVIWEHLHGYLVFCLLLLVNVLALEAAYRGADAAPWAMPLFVTTLAAGAFLYELGVLWCGVVGLYLAFRAARLGRMLLVSTMRTRLVIGMVASFGTGALYVALSLSDLYRRGMGPRGAVGPGGVTPWDLPAFLPQVLFAELWWLAGGLLPWRYSYQVTDRLILDPKVISDLVRAPLTFDFSFLLDFSLASFLERAPLAPLVVFLALPFWRGRSAQIAPRHRRFRDVMLLLLILLPLYGLLIAMGRFGERGLTTTLGGNTYYAYIFWVIATPILYWRIAPVLAASVGPAPRVAAWVAVATWIVLNARQVEKINLTEVQYNAPARNIIARVDEFAASRTSPDQRLWVEPLYDGNRMLSWLFDSRDRFRCIYLADALFPDVVAHPLRATSYLESGPTMQHWVASTRSQPTNGLLAWWRFEDPNPTGRDGVVDASPSSRDATLQGGEHCQSRLADGPSGPVLGLNGRDMYMEFPDAGLPTGAQARSLSLWLAPEANDSTGFVLGYGAPTAASAFYLQMSHGRLAPGVWGETPQPTGPPLAAKSWHHVALSYDGRAQTLWLDGAPQGSQLRALATTPTGRGLLGAMPGAASWAGYVDDVKIVDHALSAGEVAADFQGALTERR